VIYDMAGGTPDHARLAAAVTAQFVVQLRGRPCSAFSSDLKIKVPATGLTTYPDVSVVCGKVETTKESPNVVTNPTLLVEVLSDSTEAYDRGEKFAHYRRLSSLREYVLVSQHKPQIEVFRRNEGGRWELAEEAGAGERVALTSVGCVLVVDEVYADPLAASG